MKKQNLKKKQLKYDFSNAESQKLFEEFTIFLSEIAKDYEGDKKERNGFLNKSGISSYRSRELIKEIFNRFINYIKQRFFTVWNKIRRHN